MEYYSAYLGGGGSRRPPFSVPSFIHSTPIVLNPFLFEDSFLNLTISENPHLMLWLGTVEGGALHRCKDHPYIYIFGVTLATVKVPAESSQAHLSSARCPIHSSVQEYRRKGKT